MNLVILIVSLLGIGMWFAPILTNGYLNANIISFFKAFAETDSISTFASSAKALVFFQKIVTILVVVYMVRMVIQVFNAIKYLQEGEENEDFILKSIKWTATFFGIILFGLGMSFYTRAPIVKNGAALIVQAISIIAMMVIYATEKRANNDGDTRNFVRQIVASTISVVIVYLLTYPLAKLRTFGITTGGMLAEGLDGHSLFAVLIVIMTIVILIANCIHIGSCAISINKGYDIARTTRNTGITNILLSIVIILIVSFNKKFSNVDVAFVPILMAVFGAVEIVI